MDRTIQNLAFHHQEGNVISGNPSHTSRSPAVISTHREVLSMIFLVHMQFFMAQSIWVFHTEIFDISFLNIFYIG